MRQRLLDIEDSWTEPVPDENLLTGQDLIGPEPEDVRTRSAALKELQRMAGLEDIRFHDYNDGRLKTILDLKMEDDGIKATPSEVIECSATHLIGKYVGHTGPKVVELFERSLGKVSFIDEAYRLGSSSKKSFANEAIGKIVDCMTKRRYYRKIVIMLAGYTHDMDLLLKVNAGLRGRFATEINFSLMGPESALRHLCELMAKQDIELLEGEDGSSGDGKEAMMGVLEELAETRGWSKGRDMQTLAGVVTEYVYGSLDGSGRGLGITAKELVRLMGDMLQQRLKGELE
ncbi:hypothetical protein J3F83DRAFT_601118 [Trichoderma novae-zelandiae]